MLKNHAILILGSTLIFTLLSCTGLEGKSARGPENIVLSSVFSNNMVIQRNEPIKIWGKSAPGQHLKIKLAHLKKSTIANTDGKWSVELGSLPAGGPYELSINNAPVVENILIGDVWLCSGQSNMAWPVSKSTGAKPWNSNPPENIRLLTIQKDHSSSKLSEFEIPNNWEVASSENLENFSSVCALFAENTQKQEPNVALGLINSSWGGSQIEAWMSVESLAKIEGFKNDLALLEQYNHSPKNAGESYANNWMTWWESQSKTRPWEDTTHTAYSKVPALIDWNEFKNAELKNHNGMVWYTNNFVASPELENQKAKLHLGGIDEVDMTWLNGKFIGTQFGWGTPRNYEIPAGVIKAGSNTLTLNVLSSWGVGGMVGPEEELKLVFDNGSEIPLKTNWQYKKVDTAVGYPKSAPWQSINGLSGLFNAMISPLNGIRIAGTLWYQGESNTGRSAAYGPLLKSMIQDWRGYFGEKLPFIVIQLPNFGKPSLTPQESGWAALRHQQWKAINDDKYSGLVISIDAGDPNDLHPTNKTTIAKRAADIAQALKHHNKSFPIHGVNPTSIEKTKTQVVLTFAFDILNSSKSNVDNFELCDTKCEKTLAKSNKNKIFISREKMPNASKIRYCWADSPNCTALSNSEIPLSSFEIRIPNN